MSTNKDTSQETALVPIEQKQVEFYGDVITAALVEVEVGQSEVYVPLRPICDYLGLAWNGQFERIKRNPVMADSIKGVRVTRTPSDKPKATTAHDDSPTTQQDAARRSSGGAQNALCLPLEMLPGWLFGIDANRVRPELKDKIVRYQKECVKVLWRAFQSDALSVGLGLQTPASSSAEVTVDIFGGGTITTTTPTPPSAVLIQIRETALAVAQLAEQQLALEQQVDEAGLLAASAHTRLNNAAQLFKEFQERLGEVERRVASPTLIGEAQATEIGLAVKALAEQLTRKDKSSSKNYYQAVYQELYRRFGVSSYKRIRTGQFEAVMQFLSDWREAGKAPD